MYPAFTSGAGGEHVEDPEAVLHEFADLARFDTLVRAVEEKLTGTAKADSYTSVGYDPLGGYTRNTGPVTNNTWGYGKMDARTAGRTLGFSLVGTNGIQARFGPNPATANGEVYLYYDLPSTAPSAVLDVYNASGRRVHTATLSADDNVYQWSLTDDKGMNLANGIYLYVVKSSGLTSDIGKLMVERTE